MVMDTEEKNKKKITYPSSTNGIEKKLRVGLDARLDLHHLTLPLDHMSILFKKIFFKVAGVQSGIQLIPHFHIMGPLISFFSCFFNLFSLFLVISNILHSFLLSLFFLFFSFHHD